MFYLLLDWESCEELILAEQEGWVLNRVLIFVQAAVHDRNDDVIEVDIHGRGWTLSELEINAGGLWRKVELSG